MKFTEKDIATIKGKIHYLIHLFFNTVDAESHLNTYVSDKIISEEQKATIIKFITVINDSSLPISLTPLPQELTPLIEIAKHEIGRDAEKKKYTYESDYDRWDGDWEYRSYDDGGYPYYR